MTAYVARLSQQNEDEDEPYLPRRSLMKHGYPGARQKLMEETRSV